MKELEASVRSIEQDGKSTKYSSLANTNMLILNFRPGLGQVSARRCRIRHQEAADQPGRRRREGLARGAAGRSRRMAEVLQRGADAPRALVLRQDADADLPR